MDHYWVGMRYYGKPKHIDHVTHSRYKRGRLLFEELIIILMYRVQRRLCSNCRMGTACTFLAYTNNYCTDCCTAVHDKAIHIQLLHNMH